MVLKNLATLVVRGSEGICLTGVASAKEKNPILLKQVYKKEELIALDKQNVAGGKWNFTWEICLYKRYGY